VRSVYADKVEVSPPGAPTTGEAGGDLFATGTFEFVECAPWVARRSGPLQPVVMAVRQYTQGTMRFVVRAYCA
jgi:hypothetical protein